MTTETTSTITRTPWTTQEDAFIQNAKGPRKEIVTAFQETFGNLRTAAAITARIPAKKSRAATSTKGARTSHVDRVEGDASTVIGIVNAIAATKEAVATLRALCENMTDVEVDKIVRLAVGGKAI